MYPRNIAEKRTGNQTTICHCNTKFMFQITTQNKVNLVVMGLGFLDMTHVARLNSYTKLLRKYCNEILFFQENRKIEMGFILIYGRIFLNKSKA